MFSSEITNKYGESAENLKLYFNTKKMQCTRAKMRGRFAVLWILVQGSFLPGSGNHLLVSGSLEMLFLDSILHSIFQLSFMFFQVFQDFPCRTETTGTLGKADKIALP